MRCKFSFPWYSSIIIWSQWGWNPWEYLPMFTQGSSKHIPSDYIAWLFRREIGVILCLLLVNYRDSKWILHLAHAWQYQAKLEKEGKVKRSITMPMHNGLVRVCRRNIKQPFQYQQATWALLQQSCQGGNETPAERPPRHSLWHQWYR